MLQWIVLAVRLPAEPSRHRVAVWRELRRAGALSLGQGVWAMPDTPAFRQAVDRSLRLIERGKGEVVRLDATGHDDVNASRLEAIFTSGREEEWIEFIREGAKFCAELDREIAEERFTLAELDEEEQSLERLRRWFRELKLRDIFGAPSAEQAANDLKQCQTRLDGFAEQVFAALHQR
jgi:hypothetical protein